jgi:hypothetical protein
LINASLCAVAIVVVIVVVVIVVVVVVARRAFTKIVDFVARRAAAIVVVVVVSRCAIARRAVAVIVNFVARCQSPSLSLSYPVAPSPVAVAIAVVARRAVTIIVLESIRGHPILVWGSPYWFGDPQTKTGIPEPKWGCKSQRIPKPIWGSPNRNGDQYIPIPKRGSQNRFGDCSVTNQNRFGVRSNLGL